MSKERLEAIRHYYREMESFDPGTQSDINWLIEQAERVQELENHLKLYDFWYRIAYEQNKRYREALEFYADEEHYKEKLISEAQYDADGICISNDEYAPPIIYFDSGEIARQALGREE